MKKSAIILIMLIAVSMAFGQNTVLVHNSSGITDEYYISETDSMYFDQDNLKVFFVIQGVTEEYNTTDIDSITFDVSTDSTVYIDYYDSEVVVTNPLEADGVDVEVDGAYVVVTSTSDISDINYVLSGTSSEGMFKLYSDYPSTILLNNVTLTNPVGPAINIQSSEHTTIHIVPGTSNTMTDGEVYDDPVGDEDQKACVFSEGILGFNGSGALTINGLGDDQHGLCSDDYIIIDEGTITIASAVKDGIHGKDGLIVNGGYINIQSDKDGIDGDEGEVLITNGSIIIVSNTDDVKGLKADLAITISGGNVNITVNGNQSKGIKSDEDISLTGGIVTILAAGDVVLESSGSGYDPSYCTAIKGDAGVIANGATINLTATGEAARGISANGNIEILSGTVNITCSGNGARYTNEEGVLDSYAGKCLKSDVDINITGGTTTLSNSGSGGDGISADGNLTIGTETSSPNINVTTTGSSIYISGGGEDADYDESKTITIDSDIVIENGDIHIDSADDGIKSDTFITFNGGTIYIADSYEGIEAPNIYIYDGDITVYSSDDAINATYGNGGEQNDGSMCSINGGNIALYASGGDGLDSNGDIEITGGLTIVHGPQSAPEVGLDANGECVVDGGFLVISGPNSNMTEGPSNSSSQLSALFTTFSTLSANTIFHIEDNDGNDIVTFAPIRSYSAMILSTEDLETGVTYNLYTGGSSTGSVSNGLYTGGTYSGGTFKKSFTLSGTTNQISF